MSRRVLALIVLGAALLCVATAMAVPPRADAADCTGDAVATAEGFSPLSNDASADFTDTAFSCYQLQPQPSFLYHGHVHVQLISDNGDVAVADADCPFVNLGQLPVPTPLDCVYSSASPAMPHGHFTLQVSSTGAGLIPLAIGSWAGSVIMDA